MFGLVNINKLELKFIEYYQYRGYYCGLCMNLKKNYSQISRLTLNYDMTFLILILSSLYEVEDKVYNARCIVHPMKKHLIIENEITEYAAAINVILAYYSCIDDWKDEKKFKSLFFSKIIKNSYKKAFQKYEEKEIYIKQILKRIEKYEIDNSCEIEKISEEFGRLMGEVFAYKKDHWQKYLEKVGLYLGKYIYILDAYLDMDKDKKNGTFNPFINLMNKNSFIDIDKMANEMIITNLAFLDAELDKLPLIKDKGIIDNIIYSGMRLKLEKKGKNIKENERSI